MKKIFIIFAFLFSIFVPFASAHVLETDGSIGAVLHIDPEDDPVAEQQSVFFFEFKDKDNKFNPINCDCTFAILENNKTIYSQPLFQNNQNPGLSNASVFYTFPQRDVYEVQVIGKPTISNSFHSFTLTYDIRVERISGQSSQTINNQNWFGQQLVLIIGGGIILIFFAVYLILTMKKKNPTSHKVFDSEGYSPQAQTRRATRGKDNYES